MVYEGLESILQLSVSELMDTETRHLHKRIPDAFTGWKVYLSSFILPYLDNFRCELAKTIQSGPKFTRVPINGTCEAGFEDDSIEMKTTVATKDLLVAYGDVCLLSMSEPIDGDLCHTRVMAVESIETGSTQHGSDDGQQISRITMRVWHGSNSLIEASDVYIAVIGTCIPSARVMASLTDNTRQNVHPAFGSMLMQGICTTTGSHEQLRSPRNVLYEIFVKDLNQTQQTTVCNILTQGLHAGTHLIQGPPGTGKTTTITALLLCVCALYQNMKILQCAPTNIAMLEVARKVIGKVEAGVVPRDVLVPEEILIMQSKQKSKEMSGDTLELYTLEGRVALMTHKLRSLSDSTYSVLSKATAEIECLTDSPQVMRLQRKALKAVLPRFQQYYKGPIRALFPEATGNPTAHACLISLLNLYTRYAVLESDDDVSELFRAVYSNVQRLVLCLSTGDKRARQILSKRVKVCVQSRARLLFSTVNRGIAPAIQDLKPQYVVVDEAAQVLEAEITGLFTANLKALVMVGDPKQLPGTVFSTDAQAAGLQRSLFERLVEAHSYRVSMLDVQYRMHPIISHFPNNRFYGGLLADAPNVGVKPPWWEGVSTYEPLVFVNHHSTSSKQSPSGSSYNRHEAALVCVKVQLFLTECQDKGVSIGIVCPYTAQKEYLAELVEKMFTEKQRLQIAVNTIDGFQGQERDIIVISLTKTGRATSFLDDPRRMNVAITRAKFGLWVFGDVRAFPELSRWDMANTQRSQLWSQHLTHCKQEGAMVTTAPYDVGSGDCAKVLAFHDRAMAFSASWERVDNNKQQTSVDMKSTASSVRELGDRIRSDAAGLARWSIIVSDSVLRSITNASREHQQSLLQVVAKLKAGNLQGSTRPQRKAQHVAGRLLYKHILPQQKAALLWRVEIQKGRQVISIVNFVKASSIAAAWLAFQQKVEQNTEEYTTQCTTLIQHGKVIYPRTDLPITLDGLRDRKVPTRQYELSDESLQAMTAVRNKGVRFTFPYLLDETQQKASECVESAILIGRSGTGKTAIFADRLFEWYCRSVRGQMDQPRQLFISQSPGLVQQVRDEYLRRVRTFHVAHAIEISQHTEQAHNDETSDLTHSSGVVFMSVYDLLDTLDCQLPSGGTLGAGALILRSKSASDLKAKILQRSEDSGDGPTSQPHLPVYKAVNECIVDYDLFERVYYSKANDNIRRTFSASFVFAELMCVIKRDAWKGSTMQLEEYLAQTTPNLPMTTIQKEDIYKFYLKYERLKLVNGHIDLPQISGNLIQRMPERLTVFDVIYCDEVQDLLASQMPIFNKLRDAQTTFVCGGDQAQSITAGNRFRFTELKRFMHAVDGEPVSVRAMHLCTNYRSRECILQLANAVLRVLRFFFEGEIDAMPEETGMESDDLTLVPKLLIDTPERCLDFFFSESDTLSHGQVFLVRTRADKLRLQSELEAAERSATVLTILEAKGLEFDDVVLYDVFSNNPLGDRLRILYHACTEDKPTFALPTFDPKKHFALCQMLKELYVGVTRAKQRILFVESDPSYAQVYLSVLKDVLYESRIEYERSFATHSSAVEWQAQALVFEDSKLYPEARIAYLKAGDALKAKEMEAVILVRAAEGTADTKSVSQAADLFVEIGQQTRAAELLVRYKLYLPAAALYECIDGKVWELLSCYTEARQPESVLSVVRRYPEVLADKAFAAEIHFRLVRDFYPNKIDLVLECVGGVPPDLPTSTSLVAWIEGKIPQPSAKLTSSGWYREVEEQFCESNPAARVILAVYAPIFDAPETEIPAKGPSRRLRAVKFLYDHHMSWTMDELLSTSAGAKSLVRCFTIGSSLRDSPGMLPPDLLGFDPVKALKFSRKALVTYHLNQSPVRSLLEKPVAKSKRNESGIRKHVMTTVRGVVEVLCKKLPHQASMLRLMLKTFLAQRYNPQTEVLATPNRVKGIIDRPAGWLSLQVIYSSIYSTLSNASEVAYLKESLMSEFLSKITGAAHAAELLPKLFQPTYRRLLCAPLLGTTYLYMNMDIQLGLQAALAQNVSGPMSLQVAVGVQEAYSVLKSMDVDGANLADYRNQQIRRDLGIDYEGFEAYWSALNPTLLPDFMIWAYMSGLTGSKLCEAVLVLLWGDIDEMTYVLRLASTTAKDYKAKDGMLNAAYMRTIAMQRLGNAQVRVALQESSLKLSCKKVFADLRAAAEHVKTHVALLVHNLSHYRCMPEQKPIHACVLRLWMTGDALTADELKIDIELLKQDLSVAEHVFELISQVTLKIILMIHNNVYSRRETLPVRITSGLLYEFEVCTERLLRLPLKLRLYGNLNFATKFLKENPLLPISHLKYLEFCQSANKEPKS